MCNLRDLWNNVCQVLQLIYGRKISSGNGGY
jgi:hypothetical protein